MLTVRQAQTTDEIEAARAIFREYEVWLGLDLCFQGFQEELAGLPGKYAPPDGRLFLAYSEERLAGCIALRPLGSGICEMKRLFVRNEFRRLGIGRLLMEELITAAREIGYRKMRLDTYPAKMQKAVDLYRTYGFVEIPQYYENAHEGVLFMELSF
jgi:ribosomal protein S18 acetylase RimI-like enzyme